MCFPCVFCMFLGFCYVFLSVFSVFFGFVAFSSQFAAHFAVFRRAASRISRLSSILRLFLFILLSCFAILKSVPFNWLYVGLISLYISRKLYIDRETSPGMSMTMNELSAWWEEDPGKPRKTWPRVVVCCFFNGFFGSLAQSSSQWPSLSHLLHRVIS